MVSQCPKLKSKFFNLAYKAHCDRLWVERSASGYCCIPVGWSRRRDRKEWNREMFREKTTLDSGPFYIAQICFPRLSSHEMNDLSRTFQFQSCDFMLLRMFLSDSCLSVCPYHSTDTFKKIVICRYESQIITGSICRRLHSSSC